jgi:hypothetical protein
VTGLRRLYGVHGETARLRGRARERFDIQGHGSLYERHARNQHLLHSLEKTHTCRHL